MISLNIEQRSLFNNALLEAWWRIQYVGFIFKMDCKLFRWIIWMSKNPGTCAKKWLGTRFKVSNILRCFILSRVTYSHEISTFVYIRIWISVEIKMGQPQNFFVTPTSGNAVMICLVRCIRCGTANFVLVIKEGGCLSRYRMTL